MLPGFDRKILDVRRAYPNFYIPGQGIGFSTPIEVPPEAYKWEDFVSALAVADEMCAGYRCLDSNRQYVDQPFSDRLFIKELMLVEAQESHPNYREITKEKPANPSMKANDGAGDRFFDGVPCTRALFAGTYQLLGEGAETARNGLLPGQTRKTMNLVHLEVVRTKHRENLTSLHGQVKYRAYARGKEDTILEDEKKILNHPEIALQWLPTCCKNGIVQSMEIEGDWKDLPRFECQTLTLKPLIEED